MLNLSLELPDAAADLARRDRNDELERRAERRERGYTAASAPIDQQTRFWKSWDWQAGVSFVHDTLTGETAEFDLRSAFECLEVAKWVERQRERKVAA